MVLHLEKLGHAIHSEFLPRHDSSMEADFDDPSFIDLLLRNSMTEWPIFKLHH